jgi:hypothetical protein
MVCGMESVPGAIFFHSEVRAKFVMPLNNTGAHVASTEHTVRIRQF